MPLQLGSLSIRTLPTTPPTLLLQSGQTTWLWLGKLSHAAQTQLAKTYQLPTAQIIWWTGDALAGAVLKAVQPKWAIASAPQLKADTLDRLRKRHIQLLWAARDGAVQWSPETGFFVESSDYAGSL